MTANCYHHPYPAVAVCETCRRPLCSVCVRWQRGYAFCEHDLPTAPAEPPNEALAPDEDRTSFIVNYYGPMQTASPPQEPSAPPPSQPAAPETASEGDDTDEDKKYRRSMRWYENP